MQPSWLYSSPTGNAHNSISNSHQGATLVKTPDSQCFNHAFRGIFFMTCSISDEFPGFYQKLFVLDIMLSVPLF